MKRNLDLLREIMLAVEAYEPERISSLQMISPNEFSGSNAQNFHHINLLVDAHLISLAGKPDMQANFAIKGMTMDGHDFLDAIREVTIWDATKTRLRGAGGWTIDIVLAVAKEELKRRLGLSIQTE